jgi:hypothetical protein
VQTKRANAKRVKKLLGRLLGEKQTVCFLGWAEAVKETKTGRDQMLRKMFNQQLSAAFDKWADVTADAVNERRSGEERTRQEQIVARVVSRLLNRCISSALRSWGEYTKRQKQLKKKAAIIISRLMQRGLMMAMTSWADYAWRRKTTRGKIAKRIASMARDKLQLSIWSWREVVQTKRANAKRVKKLLGRLLGEKQTVCFLGWAEAVKETKTGREQMLRKMFNQQLSAAFDKWADVTAESKSAKEAERVQQKAVRILSRILMRGVAKSITSWADYAWRRKTTRGKIAKRIASMARDKLQLSIWSWREVVQRR